MLNLLEYLEDSAARVPEKIAFADENHSFTFVQLLQFARAVGTDIAQRVGRVNRPVAVLADRTAMTPAAFQAVLASGNYYAPIDAAMPEARMSAILQQLQPALLLYMPNQKKTAEAMSAFCPLIDLTQAQCTDINDALLADCRMQVLDADPAYVIFTSGSTGVPKGIACHHRGVIDLTEWLAEAAGFSQQDVLANQAPFYFDGSVKDVYLTLKCGVSCYILPKKVFMFPKMLIDELNRHQVTSLGWATSAFHLVAASGVLEKHLPHYLTRVLAGGEALLARDLNIWRRALPHVQYINLYGPTETTVDCIWYAIPPDRTFADGEAIPIGRPCRNKQVLLLDENLNPVPDGTPGEICVRGTGLACGYFGDWEKTHAAFVQNPLNPWYPDRIYRTGDIGYRGADGLIYFSSRRDGQIKHMGYRIELGEVETALSALPDVPEAVCFFDAERDRIVCCYEGTLTAAELTRQLGKRLPRYMIPNIWITKDPLPRNANGKVDRAALQEEYHHADRS